MVDNRKAQNDVVTMLFDALLKPKPTHDGSSFNGPMMEWIKGMLKIFAAIKCNTNTLRIRNVLMSDTRWYLTPTLIRHL